MPFPLLFHRLLPFGRRSEILAADYLRSLGYRIVASPYRIKAGEVDIVAWDGEILVFVEVKARKNNDPPEDSVGFQKQQRIIRAAQPTLPVTGSTTNRIVSTSSPSPHPLVRNLNFGSFRMPSPMPIGPEPRGWLEKELPYPIY